MIHHLILKTKFDYKSFDSIDLTINQIKQGRSGYVYLLKAVGTPRYKIGRSNQPLARSQKITAQSPYPLTVLDCFWTPDCVADENFFHRKLSYCRVHGEYFEFDWDMDFFDSNNQAKEVSLLCYLSQKTNLFCCIKGSYILTQMGRSCEKFLIQEYEKHYKSEKHFDVPFELYMLFDAAKSCDDLSKINEFIYEFLSRQIAFSSTSTLR